VTIKAETLGGAESGKSKCYLSNNCEGCKDIPFFKTDSTSHEQVLDSLYSTGVYDYYISCEDIAGNLGTSNLEFSVTIDSDAPKLISVNQDKQYNKLKIMLDDANDVNCEYSNKEFAKGTGNKMDNIGNSFFAPWGPGLYYIRCEDKFGNEMPLSIIHTSDIQ
ncbi:MAG: hypothetical protein KKD48_05155, partial [Nanoarchaeota archaeon]|nr:hypothetical protein [Nanoarchaeota archaeon]